jgi:hypothetical protein
MALSDLIQHDIMEKDNLRRLQVRVARELAFARALSDDAFTGRNFACLPQITTARLANRLFQPHTALCEPGALAARGNAGIQLG